MLNDKQSILLCGFVAVGIFIAGILGVLNNFIVLTILTLIFLAIIANIFYVKMHTEEEIAEEEVESENSLE